MVHPEDMPTAQVTVKAAPVAPIPDDPLTKEQWRTLMAVADTVIPTVTEKSVNGASHNEFAVASETYRDAVADVNTHALRSTNKQLTAQYLGERPSELPGFRENMQRHLMLFTPQQMRQLMQFVLNMLKCAFRLPFYLIY